MFLYGAFLYLTSTFFGFFRARFFFLLFPLEMRVSVSGRLGARARPFVLSKTLARRWKCVNGRRCGIRCPR